MTNGTIISDGLNSALADVLLKASASIGDGVNFLVGQLPEVAQQLLTFVLIQHTVVSMALVVCAICLTYASKRLVLYFLRPSHRLDPKDKTEVQNFAAFSGVVCAVVALILAVHAIFSLLVVVKVIVAPKIYLIEYAASLAS